MGKFEVRLYLLAAIAVPIDAISKPGIRPRSSHPVPCWVGCFYEKFFQGCCCCIYRQLPSKTSPQARPIYHEAAIVTARLAPPTLSLLSSDFLVEASVLAPLHPSLNAQPQFS